MLAFALVFIFATALGNNVPRSETVITRDVVIVGGGSGGTYSAIRLQQAGKSVVVIEKEAVLGGHTNTFIDPITHAPIDYGVQFFENIPLVNNYFSYLGFNTSLVKAGSSPFVNAFADFQHGQYIPSNEIPQSDPTAALETYFAQLEQYPFLNNGFDLPSPVPADLLLPFGAFIQKYSLGQLAYEIFSFSQGCGNMLAQTTLYIAKVFSTSTISGIGAGFLTSASHDNHQLYDLALAKLGSSNVLLSTKPTQINRSNQGVQVKATGPTGETIIHAKKLLIAIPPKLESLHFLDLTSDEENLFCQFNNSYYWTSIVRNSGVPDNTSISNINLAAPYAIPTEPSVVTVQATGVPGLHTVFYASPYWIADGKVQEDLLSSLAAVVKSAGYPAQSGAPQFAAFLNHSPFVLTVPVNSIQNGFYNNLNGLQGERNTWYTGAAWQAQDSGAIWNFTEANVLPGLKN